MLDAETEGEVGVETWLVTLGFEVREERGFVF
jgi:hypothetical protein